MSGTGFSSAFYKVVLCLCGMHVFSVCVSIR